MVIKWNVRSVLCTLEVTCTWSPSLQLTLKLYGNEVGSVIFLQRKGRVIQFVVERTHFWGVEWIVENLVLASAVDTALDMGFISDIMYTISTLKINSVCIASFDALCECCILKRRSSLSCVVFIIKHYAGCKVLSKTWNHM